MNIFLKAIWYKLWYASRNDAFVNNGNIWVSSMCYTNVALFEKRKAL